MMVCRNLFILMLLDTFTYVNTQFSSVMVDASLLVFDPHNIVRISLDPFFVKGIFFILLFLICESDIAFSYNHDQRRQENVKSTRSVIHLC
jgi:hypothetical protein